MTNSAVSMRPDTIPPAHKRPLWFRYQAVGEVGGFAPFDSSKLSDGVMNRYARYPPSDPILEYLRSVARHGPPGTCQHSRGHLRAPGGLGLGAVIHGPAPIYVPSVPASRSVLLGERLAF